MVTDPEQIRIILKKYFTIRGDVTIHPNGVVDVRGDVDVNIPPPEDHLPIQFGEVTGGFSYNAYREKHTWRSLKGSPHTVGYDYDCSSTRVGSLEGAPRRVGGSFKATFCNLKNLVGGPTHVDHYIARANPLMSLEGLATTIPGEIDFDLMPNLPVLRSLVASEIYVLSAMNKEEIRVLDDKSARDADAVADILQKYAGKGKAGALKAAVDLIRAGYKEHARW